MKKLCLCAALFLCVASTFGDEENDWEQICFPRKAYKTIESGYMMLIKDQSRIIDSLKLEIKRLQSVSIESISSGQ